jgi:hypothetical protein
VLIGEKFNLDDNRVKNVARQKIFSKNWKITVSNQVVPFSDKLFPATARIH